MNIDKWVVSKPSAVIKYSVMPLELTRSSSIMTWPRVHYKNFRYWNYLRNKIQNNALKKLLAAFFSRQANFRRKHSIRTFSAIFSPLDLNEATLTNQGKLIRFENFTLLKMLWKTFLVWSVLGKIGKLKQGESRYS